MPNCFLIDADFGLVVELAHAAGRLAVGADDEQEVRHRVFGKRLAAGFQSDGFPLPELATPHGADFVGACRPTFRFVIFLAVVVQSLQISGPFGSFAAALGTLMSCTPSARGRST